MNEQVQQQKDEEEAELDQLAEIELARLKRQHRIMEGDRIAYSEEVRILLQKQRQTIQKLEQEKKELLVHLNCLKSPANEAKQEKNTNSLKKLVEKHEKLEEEIRFSKSQLSELDFQIKKMEKEIQEMRKKLQERGINCLDIKDDIRTQQQLENRLDVTTVKFNRLLASNHNLREKIDHLLKERAMFNQSYQELFNKLASGKKIVMDLIEQSTSAYDQREEAQAKLEALRQRGEHELAIHSQEMRELQRRLDLHSKLFDFLAVKGQKRVMADLEAKKALTKQQEKEAMEEEVNRQENILTTIKDLCQETDVERLAALFLKHDEENFALFNYVNELNNELEMLEEQMEELERSVLEQRKNQATRSAQQLASCTQLKEKLEEQRSCTNKSQASRDYCQVVLDNCLSHIQNLFNLLIPSDVPPPVLHLLGNEKTGVTTHNVMLYLGIIGKKIDEIVN